MPTYSYRCLECGNAFDIQQGFTDDTLTACPTCAGVLRKVFSPIGVSFNGSGFYRNDSRAKPDGDKSGRDKSDSRESTSEKSSDTALTPPEKSTTTKSDTSTTRTPTKAPTPGANGGTQKKATSKAAS